MARGQHKKKKSGIGSTIIISIMFVSTIAYILFNAWYYTLYYAFMPMEITYGFFAVFCVETVSLARLRMAKEGTKVSAKTENPMLQNLGIYSMPDFENEVQQEVNNQDTSSVQLDTMTTGGEVTGNG